MGVATELRLRCDAISLCGPLCTYIFASFTTEIEIRVIFKSLAIKSCTSYIDQSHDSMDYATDILHHHSFPFFSRIRYIHMNQCR